MMIPRLTPEPVQRPTADAPLDQAIDSFQHVLDSLGWIDWTCLGIVLLGFVVGLMKGLIWQVGRLASLGIALLVAVRWGPSFGVWLGQSLGSFDGDGAGFAMLGRAILFVATLIFMWMCTSAAARRVKQGPLKAVDRMSGGFAGATFGGAMLVAALAGAMVFVPGAAANPKLQESHALHLSRDAVAALGSWAPTGLRRVYGVYQHEREPRPELPAPPAGGPPGVGDAPGNRR